MIEHIKAWTKSTENRAVAPVIGIIMMVAIAVILGAAIGTFVFDIGLSQAEEAPQVSLSVTTSGSSTIELTHTGGDGLSHEHTRVMVEVGSGTTIFEPNATNSARLTVDETAVITVNDTGDDTLDFNGDGIVDQRTDGEAGTFAPADEVTITIIDTDSQREIFQTSFFV